MIDHFTHMRLHMYFLYFNFFMLCIYFCFSLLLSPFFFSSFFFSLYFTFTHSSTYSFFILSFRCFRMRRTSLNHTEATIKAKLQLSNFGHVSCEVRHGHRSWPSDKRATGSARFRRVEDLAEAMPMPCHAINYVISSSDNCALLIHTDLPPWFRISQSRFSPRNSIRASTYPSLVPGTTIQRRLHHSDSNSDTCSSLPIGSFFSYTRVPSFTRQLANRSSR